MKKLIKGKQIRLISWILIVCIIIALAKIYPDFVEGARGISPTYDAYRVVFVMGTVIIGLLLELERLIKGLTNGLNIMWFGVILSISIIIMLLLPFVVGASITGFGIIYRIMQEGLFRGIIGVGCGVVLAQSITTDSYEAHL